MYMSQMLGSVEETSMGLLSVTPRDENGNPVDVSEMEKYVIKDENGNPLKEWDAIADYLCHMGGEMDSRYESTDGRKVVYASLNPVKLLRNANIYTYAVIILVAVLIAVTVLVVRVIIVKRKRKIKTVEQNS